MNEKSRRSADRECTTLGLQHEQINMMSVFKSPDVSIVVPAFNAESFLSERMRHLLAETTVSLEVLIVDDGSSDGTADIIRGLMKEDSRIRALLQPSNQGAGQARNAGFVEATGRYTLFFDCDDVLTPGALDHFVASADATGADVVISPFLVVDCFGGAPRALGRKDSAFWGRISEPTSFRLEDRPELLSTTNYPWNKLIRTDFGRAINLRFSATTVHNDIFAHWQILLNARLLHAVPSPCCQHIVPVGGANLTLISDRRRLALFQALQEADTLFDEDDGRREKYYSRFLDFKVEVLSWARRLIASEHRQDFDQQVIESLHGLSVSDFLRYCRMSRQGANRLRRFLAHPDIV